MTAPKALQNSPTTITVDGIDLHTYGMVVHTVSNPLPAAMESILQIKGKDGAFDFTKNYNSRVINLSGDIIADSHLNLMNYIDELNKIFRLRENGSTFKVIFSDQPNRFWSCRYSSFDVQNKALKNYGRTASFSLSLICAKPWAEAINPSYGYARISLSRNLSILYNGSMRTPINYTLVSGHPISGIINILGNLGSSKLPLFWTGNNCEVTANTSDYSAYGDVSIVATRTAAGNYSLSKSGLLEYIDTTKPHVFIIKAKCTADVILKVVLTGGTNAEKTIMPTTIPGGYSQGYTVLAPEDFEGVTAVNIEILVTSSDSAADTFSIDGMAVYQLSEQFDSDFTYDYFVPPPYIVSNNVELTNPKLLLMSNQNLFDWKYSDGISGHWNINSLTDEVISITKNPIGNGQCLLFCSEGAVSSPRIPMTKLRTYRIYFETLCTMYKSTGSDYVRIFAYVRDENSNLLVSTGVAIYETSDTWVRRSLKVENCPEGAMFCELWIANTACDLKLFIKDIQIVEEFDPDDPAESYANPVVQYQKYTGTITGNDELNVDNENIVVRFNDWENKEIVNGISSFTGDSLMLSPGYNILSLRDARWSEDNGDPVSAPQGVSQGTAGIIYSYIERYL